MSQQVLIWCCFLFLVDLVFALTGDNVCKRVETKSETVEYVVQEPVTYRLYTWCLKMPPRCSKYSTVMKERIKSRLQVNNHTIDFCCAGYVEITNFCVPECNKTECPNMKCDGNKKCNCLPGYTGARCHLTCRHGLYGENCLQKCVCNGNPCDLKTGDCIHTTTTPATSLMEINPSLQQTPSTLKPQHKPSTSPASTTYISQKPEKTDLSEEIDPDSDPTAMPEMPDDVLITLLPDDEVIIVYPSSTSSTMEKYFKPATSNISPTVGTFTTKQLIKTFTTSTTGKVSSTSPTTEKYITKDSIVIPTFGRSTVPTISTEKPNLWSTINHLSKISEINIDNKNELIDGVPTREPQRITTSTQRKKNNYDANKIQPTEPSNVRKYGTMSIPKQEGNGLPPPVSDNFGNTLQINGRRNFSTGERSLLPDDVQRDMSSGNANNFNAADITVNSSLVKAKWNSSLEIVDFSSISILISLTAVVLLSGALIIASVIQCKKAKTEPTVYESTVQGETASRAAHYATPGQPIFFCQAFSNTYAFELAQELREAQYDHPKSARCLNNEPVYAELRY